MTNQVQHTTKRNRIYWMDNLRTIIILLVVLYHVGGVYEAAGLWASFWIVDDPATITWVGIVGILFDVFIMGTLFFLIIGPIAVLFRIFGKDPMHRGYDPAAPTYWLEASPARDKESYFHQY